jgi:hypothetical protein
MSIIATLYDVDLNPTSRDFEIHDDDFATVEKAAADLGAKCCIRWVRDEDGQALFWGSKGAQFKPHWYSPLGRPVEMTGGKRVNLYLDAPSLARAAELGGGNVSEGVRIALAK